MIDWQPIETAPKDGRVILCIGHGNNSHVEPMMWYPADEGMDSGCWGWLEGDTPRKPPTHWMPLPAPPAAVTAAPDLAVELAEALRGFIHSISGRNTLEKMLTINHNELLDLVSKGRAALAKYEARNDR